MPQSEPTVHELLTFHYECLQSMYFSEYLQIEDGALLFSNLIKDPYYNFFSPEHPIEDLVLPSTVLDEFRQRGRQPAVYVTPLAGESPNVGPPTVAAWARDAWLVGRADQLAQDALTVDGLSTQLVDSSRRDEYVSTFTTAYSGEDPDDPYGQLDPAYSASLKASFGAAVSGYEKYYLLATLRGTPVGVAAMFTAGTLAGVYGVGTTPPHRRAGIGQAMMAHLARIAAADGASHIMLQTEAGSGVQRWYEKLGYQHRFTAHYVEVPEKGA